MKNLVIALPLIAAAVSGCEYTKNPNPVHPSTIQEDAGSSQDPAPPPPSYPHTGPELVAYINEHYPERLAGGVSRDERVENMRFVRDRMIEAGLCGGMTLGWNMKRGGPEISTDFLAWRRDDGDMGVDIAFDYDNTSAPLRLQWMEAGFSGTHYAEYPPPSCQ